MEPRIITLPEIKAVAPSLKLTELMAEGFKAYSAGAVEVPPVGELVFDDPPGDVHIKYGYIRQAAYYVIKIASGFYDNPKIGLPSSNGLMLLFSQQTGALKAILLDEGYLTDLRTAAAGALCAQLLQPPAVSCIGIVGTGIQARLQLRQLAPVQPCRKVLAWARSKESGAAFAASLADTDFQVDYTLDAAAITSNCQLIVTTTPSETPLLMASDIQPGTHITAVGSDTAHKIELDPQLLARADRIISDSLPQSKSRGEIYQAVKAGAIAPEAVTELGHLLAGPERGRTATHQITVADLTGVAVQDIQIATAIYESLLG